LIEFNVSSTIAGVVWYVIISVLTVLQVESFEDLQKDAGIAIHKPFYCSLHPGESVKFFCIGCQVMVLLLIDFV